MANRITGQPILIDTAAATVITRTPFRVQALKWVIDAGGADNDELIVHDQLGVVKYHDIINITTSGLTVAMPMTFPIPVLFNGLIVPTMSGGTLYIYLADPNNLVAA